MQDVLDDIAARSGLEPEIAHTATTLVAHFLATNLPRRQADDLRRRIPALGDLSAAGHDHTVSLTAQKAGAGNLTAGLLSGVGGMLGGAESGPTARIMVLVGNLSKLGMSFADMRALSDAMIAHMRATAGDAYVDDTIARTKAKIPVLGRFLD